MYKARPYHHIPIHDSGEPLVEIPLDKFAVISPHLYQQAGASYPDYSPYHLRQGAIDRLFLAQEYLQTQQPGWQLAIFDAYRPVAVQKFMVEHTFKELVQARGWQRGSLTPEQSESLWELVHQIWAVPNYDRTTPPPHSTGGAVDLALADATGAIVDFGSPIDEISERSHPDYYAPLRLRSVDVQQYSAIELQQSSETPDSEKQTYHQRRLLLKAVMEQAGFQRHPGEWWHFCYGDQMWAWLSEATTAIYGRVEE
jgi:zinc D-Ala-D-Ala dipeptidase